MDRGPRGRGCSSAGPVGDQVVQLASRAESFCVACVWPVLVVGPSRGGRCDRTACPTAHDAERGGGGGGTKGRPRPPSHGLHYGVPDSSQTRGPGGGGGGQQWRGHGAGGGGGWHKASVSKCVPLAAPIGLSPPLILTLCGPERVLVVSTEPPDDLSCLTTPGVGCP